MNSFTLGQAIFQRLCEEFKRDEKDGWANVYALGEELGYSEDEVREALRDFEKADQSHVEIHLTAPNGIRTRP
jgi:hypothetical protein